MAAVTICSDFGGPQNKVSHCFHIYLPWSGGTGCRELSFLNFEFQANFSLSFFIFIKRLFSSSSLKLSTIRMLWSAYLRLLIFLLAMLIQAFALSSLAFHMMFSAYKLISRVTIYNLDVLLSQFGISLVPCPVLTLASWPAYRFLRREVRWSIIPISVRIFHSLLWST